LPLDRPLTTVGDVDDPVTERAELVELSVEDPASTAARFCLSSYYAELQIRFDHGFDTAAALSADPDELRPPAGLFVVARLDGDPVGCGALKFNSSVPAYIKRMWIAPEARGLGVGRRLLQHLEWLAHEHGDDTVHLETNRNLAEAIHLYRSSGYEEVPPFNDEPYADHWFRKRLSPP
jgi:GNAT superfamily N-acetyltransferase